MLSGSAGADPATRTRPAAGSACSPARTASSWWMRSTRKSPTRCVAAIRKISPEPIRFLVNTHVHGDHTAGNANFVKMGALLFAREELREETAASTGGSGEWQPGSRAGSGPASGRDLRDGRSGEASHERRNRRPDSGSGGPYRRRYDDPVRECGRDHDRRLLPELRVSLHRHQQRRHAEGRAGSARRSR